MSTGLSSTSFPNKSSLQKEPDYSKIPFDISDELKSLINAAVDSNKTNAGVVVGLVDPNGTQFYGYGKMSNATNTTVDENTIFAIGSNTIYGDGWMASAYNITPDKFREKWNIIMSYRKRLGRDSESFGNCVMSMFGYIDNDKDKVRRMVKDILSPALGRPVEQLENPLLFGSVEECIQKINALREAGVKCIHFWPISDFEEQIEIFRKEIVCHY